MCTTLAFAGASAFCAAEDTPASTSTITPRVPEPSLVDPAPTVTPRVPERSLVDPAALKPVGPEKPPAPRLADIALVLPLESPDYGRASEALRDGFLAAAQSAVQNAGTTPRVRVISHGDGNVLAGFAAAQSLGVRVVVGPLVRDDLRALAATDRPLPLTLALNQLDDGAPLPPTIYTLALAVESDARVLARRMRADNLYSVAVIGGDAPLMKRFATAFTAEWLLVGGGAPQSFAFEPTSDGLGVLRRQVAKSSADGALIALDGSAAALARTFAPRLPAYASSLVNQGLDPAVLRDLEGVVFVDIPWIVTPDEPTLANLPRRAMGNLVLDRLYALGLDAYQVARAFLDAVPERLQIRGATGRLTLAEGRQFLREGTVAVIRGGQVVPADARR